MISDQAVIWIHARLWCSIFVFIRCNCCRSLSISRLLLFRLSLNDTCSLSATLWSLGSSSSFIDSSTACNFIFRDLFSFSRFFIFVRHFWNSSELLTCVGKSEIQNTLFCNIYVCKSFHDKSGSLLQSLCRIFF